MNPMVSGSSSAEKARVLPRALAGTPPSLVIAFGTAGYPEDSIMNGSVVIGSRVFIHDPQTSTPERYKPKRVDGVTPGNLPEKFFRNIDGRVRGPAEQAFLRTPLASADPPIILAGNNWVSVGTVNVTNYDDYVWTDPEAIAAFKSLSPKKTRARIGSMETTHGIIQELSEPAPFLFVSGIANRVPYFDIQNVPRNYAQNFVAAHNAGVALAWLLPEAVRQLGL
jgi:hypothetical protein